jgi:phage gpG-like protein
MVYSRIHELGGKINHTNLFGKGIKATITMPKRAYLSPSLQAKKKEIVDILLNAMIAGYKRS